jgi:low affinity Fe/Cu permease
MIIAGLLTCSMIFAVFAPEAALISMFGEALTEPLAQIVVRSWGFLIFLIGTLLIYGAYTPEYRNLALVITSMSKIAFIAIIIIFGPQYIDKSILTIALDSALVAVFLTYLIKAKSAINQ